MTCFGTQPLVSQESTVEAGWGVRICMLGSVHSLLGLSSPVRTLGRQEMEAGMLSMSLVVQRLLAHQGGGGPRPGPWLERGGGGGEVET